MRQKSVQIIRIRSFLFQSWCMIWFDTSCRSEVGHLKNEKLRLISNFRHGTKWVWKNKNVTDRLALAQNLETNTCIIWFDRVLNRNNSANSVWLCSVRHGKEGRQISNWYVWQEGGNKGVSASTQLGGMTVVDDGPLHQSWHARIEIGKSTVGSAQKQARAPYKHCDVDWIMSVSTGILGGFIN